MRPAAARFSSASSAKCWMSSDLFTGTFGWREVGRRESPGRGAVAAAVAAAVGAREQDARARRGRRGAGYLPGPRARARGRYA